jgi:adenosine deaminase
VPQVEWDILAAWVVAHNLASNNVVWLIQIPRLYNVYRDQGIIENFAQVCGTAGVRCELCTGVLTHFWHWVLAGTVFLLFCHMVQRYKASV